MLSLYDVDSIEIKSGRSVTSTIMASSIEDALRFEKLWFGEPYFRVLRARPHLTQDAPDLGESVASDSVSNPAPKRVI